MKIFMTVKEGNGCVYPIKNWLHGNAHFRERPASQTHSLSQQKPAIVAFFRVYFLGSPRISSVLSLAPRFQKLPKASKARRKLLDRLQNAPRTN